MTLSDTDLRNLNTTAICLIGALLVVFVFSLRRRYRQGDSPLGATFLAG